MPTLTLTASGAGMLMGEEPAVGSSDTDGNFELTGLRAGTYHVMVGVGLSANGSFSAPGEDTSTGDDTGAFVFISKVASSTSNTKDPYSGDVTVTASVERGDGRFEKLTWSL